MRTWGIAIGVVLALAAGVYFLGPQIYVRHFLDDFNCEPAVSSFARADTHSPAASRRLEELFQQDQADRRALGSLITPDELATRDAQRRHEVLRYITEPALHTPEDLYHAAMIFQHGRCADHIELAHGIATLAMELGHEPAKWLYAATLDRYLRKIGQPQCFGTRYDYRGRCRYLLGRVVPTTTDQERSRYNVPSLAEARAQADVLAPRCRG